MYFGFLSSSKGRSGTEYWYAVTNSLRAQFLRPNQFETTFGTRLQFFFWCLLLSTVVRSDLKRLDLKGS